MNIMPLKFKIILQPDNPMCLKTLLCMKTYFSTDVMHMHAPVCHNEARDCTL